MSLEIDLYRHAHIAENDSAAVVIGQSPYLTLDAQGVDESMRLGEFMNTNGLRYDLTMSSFAVRAVDTTDIALHAASFFGDNRRYVISRSNGLAEQNLGDHEGKPRVNVYTPLLLARINREGADYVHPNGESLMQASTRMFLCVQEIAGYAVANGLERVSATTHNISLLSLLARVNGLLDPGEMQEFVRSRQKSNALGNVSLTRLIWEKEKLKIDFVGQNTIG